MTRPTLRSLILGGRTALVTGASRGLGRAIALRLAREGAAVGVNYREQGVAAAAVVEEIQAHGGRALAVRADVADAGQVVTWSRVSRLSWATWTSWSTTPACSAAATSWTSTSPRRTEPEFASIAVRAMVRRVGEPEDIANAVASLASPGSGFVTAQLLTADGGRMDYIGHP